MTQLGRYIIGGALMLAALGVVVRSGDSVLVTVLLLFSFIVLFKWNPRRVKVASIFDVNFGRGVDMTATTLLPIDVRRQKEEYAAQRKLTLPGHDAPSVSLEAGLLGLSKAPVGSPLVPMYLLDESFRVLDWNEAFSLAFDNTLEGRRGLGILEWTYFLDNYEDVLNHGIEVFSGNDPLPTVDVEEVRYTSKRYGVLVGEKRAYRIPDPEGGAENWLVTITPEFRNPGMSDQFYLDLARHLEQWLVWTEYALSYDDVLTNTNVYPELLETIIGKTDGLEAVPPGATVLDLGCGTGNLALELVSGNRYCEVTAVDSNDFMLATLRRKCKAFLRSTENPAGSIIAVKQNITNLFGLEDEHYQYAIANNVLYSLPTDAIPAMLEELHRKLKTGGEFRATGPRKNVKLARLFRRIKKDLQSKGRFELLEDKYEHVRYINEVHLAPQLTRLGEAEYKTMLANAGFEVVSSQTVYEGQAWYVVGRKTGPSKLETDV